MYFHSEVEKRARVHYEHNSFGNFYTRIRVSIIIGLRSLRCHTYRMHTGSIEYPDLFLDFLKTTTWEHLKICYTRYPNARFTSCNNTLFHLLFQTHTPRQDKQCRNQTTSYLWPSLHIKPHYIAYKNYYLMGTKLQPRKCFGEKGLS